MEPVNPPRILDSDVTVIWETTISTIITLSALIGKHITSLEKLDRGIFMNADKDVELYDRE